MQGLLPIRVMLRSVCSALVPDTCLLCDAPGGRVANLCAGCAASLVRLPCQSRTRVVAFAYTPPMSSLIHWMKFEANLPAALTLGSLLAEAIVEAGAVLPDAILPVPLHRSRLRCRGFNQALEIARPLSRRLGLPLMHRTCVRLHPTRPQSSLDGAAQRKRNVAGAFRVCEPMHAITRIAIVDDVLTTGATAQELARTLRAAGIKQVLVWACAG